MCVNIFFNLQSTSLKSHCEKSPLWWIPGHDITECALFWEPSKVLVLKIQVDNTNMTRGFMLCFGI